MNEQAIYAIAAVEDFFSVPKHRRALMLHEFGLWMNMHDRMAGFKNDPDSPAGLVITTRRETFRWIDDDKGQAVISIQAIAPIAQDPAP